MCCIELRDAMTLWEDPSYRASCLPESSGRALVADAREDSPVSDALLQPLRSVTNTEFATLPHLRNATLAQAI
jgi:hypothetical protein